MEYCDGGSLAMIMAKFGEPLTEQEIQVVMKHMLIGLEFLHSKRMIHRDIKADNVLITTEGKAKLGIFPLLLSTSHIIFHLTTTSTRFSLQFYMDY
jgi:serine/threonine protein kinase